MRKDLLRPTTLEEYIGQEGIKDLLRTAITAARGRNEPLDHILLNGPPGLGKTTLANIIGREMEWKIKAVIGPTLGGAADVEKLLAINWKPLTILFIDEVHRVRKPAQEVLYPVLEDNVLQFSNSNMDLAPLTVIGATTNIGRLERPFIDRFGLSFQLQYYTYDELAEIIGGSAEKLKVKLTFAAIDQISYRARGTPRIANNILKRIRDYADVLMPKEVDAVFADKVITDKLHIDSMGLRLLDHRYMRALTGGKILGVDAIASKLNEEVETVEDVVEPYLIRLGFINRERTGRCLTAEGERYLTSIPRTFGR